MTEEEKKAKAHAYYLAKKDTPEYRAAKKAGRDRYKAKHGDPTKAARNSKRRAIERDSYIGYMPSMPELIAFYGPYCMKCGADEVTLDHIIPLSKGGDHALYNVQLLCMDCNRRKNGVGTQDYRKVERWVDRLSA